MTIGRITLWMAVLALLTMVAGGPVMAKGSPVAMIMNVKGTVEYTKNGTKWKKVRRNKFLFSGYQIRTSGDGSGTLINQKTNMSRNLSASSQIKIGDEGASVVTGSLSDPSPASGDVLNGLKNRFAKAQRYTTVRRSVNKPGAKIKLSTAKKIALSPSFPDLVWENLGPAYSYRLVIGDKSFEVTGSDAQFVRFKVSGLSAGQHPYRVEVLEKDSGKAVVKPRRDSKITWLSGGEATKIDNAIQHLKKIAPGDDFLIASFLEEKGVTVGALDHYIKYFNENPDDNDMRPMLIKAYHDLKLKALKKAEAIRYNEILQADG
ncbi:MAG: hypothetical protein HQL53_05820 [Magnetococcales bacterium]|nr:hypothetical protein [Magnetococcales bacterium]